MIMGVTTADLLHSGCRNSWQPGAVPAAHCSAHSKSDLLKMTTFNSLARGTVSGGGALNFFGERQIHPHSPLSGQAPEVSIWVANPAWPSRWVRAVQSCIRGSPPVMTAILPG